MNPESNSIPNIGIENIGSKTKSHHVTKGFITLPCWEGHYLYDAADRLKKDKVVTNGRIELWVDAMIDENNSIQYLAEQINAYHYLVEQQETIRHAVLQKLKENFPDLLANEYASWDHNEPYFPKPAELTDEFDFKNYIGPASIRITEDVKDGSAYVIWTFRCRWDIEHGLDFTMHEKRVIEIATEADPWKIYQDNGTFEQKQQDYKQWERTYQPPTPKKWWKFW
ncbi:hypothetical protein [Paraflavitalea sp. CAU 1676]|uniref:DUF6985 domain-containing protein n=1 Tax=Paraflavitalea sp. CAU 1676 TaxID=3032598 RepID=UPI0023DA43AC|nr:hypothetical protein [Paraflavitalea sp. CAU 1676]MDF2190483.1 hypothetical protein [Paraflavitalea sp. CAU 1676]